ncbi:MAG: hypothetical protein A3B68_02645 [Candidatus Melainabacteria bacterium RIFCSPHIGHO2_02_FULL_34_12]|nr:MAG: hypothetical protein A3B68_02645 [Candidatus Melainabacteria bacterium RIFCSPHIGHO2_02_FULL_34_12]
MNKLILEDYNLEMTLLGGQAFNWDFEDECFYGFTQSRIIKLMPVETCRGKSLLQWQTYPENDDIDFLKSYLRLDVNYKNILNKIQKDRYVKTAVKKYPNLRLVKQDFEETLLSFIISTNNNIKSIRKYIRLLSQKFGKSINVNGDKYYLFPRTEVIAEAKLEDLLSCSLGFRAKYLKGTAKYLLENKLTKKIHKLSEENTRIELKKIKGVGDKITDCVMVFSLGFDNITPLDVWGKRVLTDFYKVNKKMKYKDMRRWIENYFEGYAGWAGQFLFEYIRHQ